MRIQPRQTRAAAASGGVDVDSLVLFKSGFQFAKQHYWLTLVYIFGLVLVQFATGFAVTPTQQEEFKQVLSTIDVHAMEVAKQQAVYAYDAYRASRGWFFTCDEECTELYQISQQADLVLRQHEEQYDLALSNARSKVGVFSEYAVEDARETWWDAYERGVTFAKRMSYYDAFSITLSSMRRDDSLLSVVLQFILSAIMNFIVGMFSAFISFFIHAIQLVVSYQAHPVTGLVFVLMAASGAFSIVASFAVGAYLVAATATFVGLKTISARIAFEQEQRRPIRDHSE